MTIVVNAFDWYGKAKEQTHGICYLWKEHPCSLALALVCSFERFTGQYSQSNASDRKLGSTSARMACTSASLFLFPVTNVTAIFLPTLNRDTLSDLEHTEALTVAPRRLINR